MSKKRKKKKRVLLLVLEFLFIIVGAAGLYMFYQLDRIPKADINKDNIEVNEINSNDIDGYRNIAIFGVDSRANDLKKNTRSDSIMVASINRKTKDVRLISIYRDTYVYIDEEHGYTKLNHAYSYGGPELAMSVINRNFDLDIKEFITVNFSAVTNIVDLLGGVDITIESQTELKELNRYTKDMNKINKKNSDYLSSTGLHTLNGTQATAYCRVRYTAGGDFKRSERQRNVINEIMKKAKSSNIITIGSIVNEMMPQIYTNLKSEEILMLAKDIFAYNLVKQEGFPFEKGGKTVNKTSYVFADNLAQNVTELHSYLFDSTDYVPSKIVQDYSSVIEGVYK